LALSVENKPQNQRETEAIPSFLREAIEDKETLAHVFSKKAFETKDAKLASFYYLVATFLRDKDVKPFGSLMATDGENFYVGPAYVVAKQKYEKKIVPFLWLHEVMHIIHAHPERMKLVPDKELYNIVADLYINTLLENRVGKIPNDFVIFTSFIDFIVAERGKDLTPEEKRVLEEVAKLVFKEKITVEEAYAVIEQIPSAKEELKKRFEKSAFFGNDMRNKNESTEEGERGEGEKGGSKDKEQKPKEKGEDEKDGGGEGNEQKTGEKISGSIRNGSNLGEKNENKSRKENNNSNADELEQTLKELKEKLDEIAEKTKKAMGEFNALRRINNTPPGTEEGVFGRAEYEEMQNLRVEVEKELLEEIGREVKEHEVNYSRFSKDAYWLPEDKEIFRNKIVVFLDTSGSVPEPIANLFMNWVNKAVKKYGIEADVVVFGVGVLEKQKDISSSRKLKNVALGGGTVWDKSVAEEIIKAKKSDVPLIVVLSDMQISLSDEALEAISLYKKHGGKVVCWTTFSSMDFCDKTHRFPRTFRALY